MTVFSISSDRSPPLHLCSSAAFQKHSWCSRSQRTRLIFQENVNTTCTLSSLTKFIIVLLSHPRSSKYMNVYKVKFTTRLNLSWGAIGTVTFSTTGIYNTDLLVDYNTMFLSACLLFSSASLKCLKGNDRNSCFCVSFSLSFPLQSCLLAMKTQSKDYYALPT